MSECTHHGNRADACEADRPGIHADRTTDSDRARGGRKNTKQLRVDYFLGGCAECRRNQSIIIGGIYG
jgi:hypothetical protein